ncbi:GGDEF domain-containing protein [Ensifer sp. IC3342]|nr:GGDEF domain-containing protein [Ensifer sp. BRP08]MCA1447565.1 GGDEF domain-containing protein [Ensifer sp. IC3342]
MLQSVGRLLPETVRQSDVVARIGGEEFVVFLPNTELGNARLLAERIRQNVQRAGIEVEGRQIRITTSVGWHWHHGIGRRKAAATAWCSASPSACCMFP